MADITQWLESLSEEERARIRPVLERDMEFQRREKARVRSLRSHVEGAQTINLASSTRRGSNYALGEEGESASSTNRSCYICGAQLSFWSKWGANCPGCRQRVCVNCRKNTRKSWLCPSCYTESRRHRSSSRCGSTDDGSESGTSRSRRSTVSTGGGYETPPPDAPRAPAIPSLTIESFDRPVSTDPEDIFASRSSSMSSSSYRSSWTSPEFSDLLQSPLATPIKAYSTGQLPNRTVKGRRNRKDEYNLLPPTTNRATSDPNIPSAFPTTEHGSKTPKGRSKASTMSASAKEAADDSMETVSLYSQASHKSSSFRGSSTSLADVGSIQGDILLRLHYNCRQGALEVFIDRCRNLIENKRVKPNPYVKLYLYPSESAEDEKRKTKTKRQTSEPLYQELLKYPSLTKSELDKRSLFISVWHNDFFGRNSFLGEVRIDLADYPWHVEDIFCYPLGAKQDRDPPDPMQPPGNKRGTLRFSIKFAPPDPKSKDLRKQKSGSVTCTIVFAHAAHGHPPEIAIAPFVKGCLYLDEKRSVRLRTPIAKLADGQDPTWNHNFLFHSQNLSDLPQRSLQLTAWDQQGLTTRRFLGRLHLNNPAHKNGRGGISNGCQCLECDVWRKMMENPNSWIDTELALRG